ncbi:MAG: TauD/TfdA family dioxygenase [Rhodospirillales bacterium]|nr:TauD/TfdA family dioxygenase [Rhodospirillales bacterium]
MDTPLAARLEIRPLSGALGAELLGIDLGAGIDDATVAAIRRALLDHLVVFFRDQALTPAGLVALGRRFGDLSRYPMVKGLAGHPEVIEVVKLPHEHKNFGGIWHSDTAYLDEPPMGTMLLAHELPPVGGDTLFANMYLAYETLSPGMQRMLEGLRAVNNTAVGAASRTREDADERRGYEAEHPVVRTHPETGRKALYVNAGHTERFAGMTRAESAPLLDFLYRHLARPEFTCRFRWAPGSLAFWDNRATQHNPVNDYHGHTRRMYRISIAGDRPR